MMSSQYPSAPSSALNAVKSIGTRQARDWWLFAALMLSYKLLLDISYDFISFAFGYQALFYNGRTPDTQLLSWLALIISLPALKRLFDDRSASGNVLSLLALFSYVPTISVISFRPDYDPNYVILIWAFWAMFYFWWRIIEPIHFRTLARIESRSIYLITAFVLSFAVIIYSYINIGFRLHFNLIEVYDIREEARQFTAPFPLNYFVSLADNLLAVIAVFCFMKGRNFTTAVLIIIIFINFSISGTKQVVFVPLLGFIGYFLFKNIESKKLLFAGTFIAAACAFESNFSNSITLNGIFTYRVLFIPAELHYAYYEYFQSHDLLFYSQSFLRPLFDGNQDNIQFIIGERTVGSYTARANNGLFSDAYMNLGAIGVFIYPIILSTFLRILDGAFNGLSDRMRLVVVLYVAFVLLGMTFTSALFTSGLLVLVFLLYSLPRNSASLA